MSTDPDRRLTGSEACSYTGRSDAVRRQASFDRLVIVPDQPLTQTTSAWCTNEGQLTVHGLVISACRACLPLAYQLGGYSSMSRAILPKTSNSTSRTGLSGRAVDISRTGYSDLRRLRGLLTILVGVYEDRIPLPLETSRTALETEGERKVMTWEFECSGDEMGKQHSSVIDSAAVIVVLFLLLPSSIATG